MLLKEELLNNPYMIKALKQIAKGQGSRIGEFMIAVREGRITDKEIENFLKKDIEKLIENQK